MDKQNLLMFDDVPGDLRAYLKNYGFHFNKKLCDFAVSLMKKENHDTHKLEPLEIVSKEEVEELLRRHNIVLERKILSDAVFVYAMAMSDFYKSSIQDEQHLALYIKDAIDDKDQRDGYLFIRWYANTLFNGIPIDWVEFI